jgi:hypothetical protein
MNFLVLSAQGRAGILGVVPTGNLKSGSAWRRNLVATDSETANDIVAVGRGVHCFHGVWFPIR